MAFANSIWFWFVFLPPSVAQPRAEVLGARTSHAFLARERLFNIFPLFRSLPKCAAISATAGAAFFAYFLSLLKESRSGFGVEDPEGVTELRQRAYFATFFCGAPAAEVSIL